MDAHVLAGQVIDWLAARPPWLSIGVCGLVAGVEYVIPPLPHDVVVVAGGVLAARDVLNPWALLVVVTLGSTLGALAAWKVGDLAATRPGARRFVARFMSEAAFERTAAQYRRFGRLLLAANRFLPGVRTTLLFGAGLFRMRAVDVVIFGALSAFLWNSLLIGAGVLLGRNLDDVLGAVEEYSLVAGIAVGVAVLLLVARAIWRARARRRAGTPP